MPTKREREYYAMGFRDGVRSEKALPHPEGYFGETRRPQRIEQTGRGQLTYVDITKPKRKLSAWQRYIKNKRNHITYRDGKLNLKAMGVQYRKKKRR